ncbi:UNVERIFIED_CONTAM: hypothetical protein FKN15_036744 [Acipenser sinensis]
MNGEMQRENGQGDLTHAAPLRSTLEETLQQMNILIKENRDLKEALKHTNTSMKGRFEDLTSWKEKQKEERDFLEDKLQEAKGRVAALTKRNEEQRKKIQMFEGNGPESSQGIVDHSLEVEQLKAMISRLQAEKCDLVAMNSELQLKQRSDSPEDSFIEIRIAVSESKSRLKCFDESNTRLESEELTVSQLLQSLRLETQKVEKLELELRAVKERMSDLEKRKLNVAESGTQTEVIVDEKPSSVPMEVEATTTREITAETQHDVEVQYQNETLKLQVDSLQSMSKMEQMKTEDEKRKLIQLQDAYAKLFEDYTAMVKATEEMKPNMSKEEMSEVNDRLIAAEEALAVKQQKIDEMKQQMFKQEQELETVSLFKAQADIYSSDFYAERAAREKIHEEKERIVAQLEFIKMQNCKLQEEMESFGRQSLNEVQRRHVSRGASPQQNDQQPNVHGGARGAENRDWQQQVNIPERACPKCDDDLDLLASLLEENEAAELGFYWSNLGDDDLDLLASLLEENEAAERGSLDCEKGAGDTDELDDLFDADDDGEEFDEVDGQEGEGVSEQVEDINTLFGDVEDLEEEEPAKEMTKTRPSSKENQDKSKQDLEAELRRMQEQMETLQKQLAVTQQALTSPPQKTPPNKQKQQPAELRRMQEQMETLQKQLAVTQQALTSPPQKTPPNKQKQQPEGYLLTLPKLKRAELYWRPRVSSTEMERKMSDRKMIRLSQLPEKLAREKLDESDWVTFGVVVNKFTPQSSSSGKTFSIWRLTDLRNLDVYVSLFLFGDVHKEHWKTDTGTVIGILNPNPMKPKEGSDGVCLSVDHPQKVLLMGEAQDFGTCRAKKKNGDPCTQIVNLNECQFCQYHVKAQYKKLSSKRSELQSSFSGKVPGKQKGKGGSLKQRLCHDGFYYGGVSSAACAASLSASISKKPVQSTLSNLFVKGADSLAKEAQKRAMQSNRAPVCSDEFKNLMDVPTPGALNLKRHLTQASAMQSNRAPVCSDEFKNLMDVPTPGALNLKRHLTQASVGLNGKRVQTIQSISATQLLKQQKQQMLEARKKRSEDIQRRFLQNTGTPDCPATPTPGRSALASPRAAAEFPKDKKTTATPLTPKLGRGFADGDDVLFFDGSPPPAPKPNLSAAKLAALKKLRAKEGGISKEDPNGVKRKRSDTSIKDVAERVEKSLASLETKVEMDETEPASKKRREQLEYLQSAEFQEILNAKSRHTGAVKEAEIEIQERYFEPLVNKEQMEDKMRNIRELKCRAVTCKTEKKGPKIGAELLLTRGEEQPKFLNSLQ